MALLTDQLVGRAEELGSFEQALEEVDLGGAGAIQLVGEPGIGKSRLLAEFAARADAKGRLVLAGSASELERDLPFAVFVDALDEYLRGLDPSRLDQLDEDVLAELAHVFPSLSGRATAPVLALQHERYRTHRAVRALFELLAKTRPLILMLDDFHWADSASIELLGALLRRPPAAPVLVAVAVRPRQMPERLAAALERALRTGSLTRLELGALTQTEARELIGERVDVLYAETGGNPFYLEQLSRSVTAERASSRSPEVTLTGIDVPSAVAASLNEELAFLSESARRVFEGAAVAGDPFEPELAAAASDVSESEAMDAVDELLQLDLVRDTDVPRRFRFRHPLVRRAVYETDTRRLAAGSPRALRAACLRAEAHPQLRAPITCSARRARAMPRRLRCCAKPARKPSDWHRRALRNGSPTHCACSRTRRSRSESSSSAHARARSLRSAALPTAMPLSSKRSRSCPRALRCCGPSSRARAPRLRASGAARASGCAASRAPSKPWPTKAPRRRWRSWSSSP